MKVVDRGVINRQVFTIPLHMDAYRYIYSTKASYYEFYPFRNGTAWIFSFSVQDWTGIRIHCSSIKLGPWVYLLGMGRVVAKWKLTSMNKKRQELFWRCRILCYRSRPHILFKRIISGLQRLFTPVAIHYRMRCQPWHEF